MKVCKINFDNGSIRYYNRECLEKECHIHTFHEICEWVWAFRLPMDQIMKKVIFKEKLVPILESYIKEIDQELKGMNCLTELYLIELCGIPISYTYIQAMIIRYFELLGYNSELLKFRVNRTYQ